MEEEEGTALDDEDGATKLPLLGFFIVPLAARSAVETIDMLNAMSESESLAFW